MKKIFIVLFILMASISYAKLYVIKKYTLTQYGVTFEYKLLCIDGKVFLQTLNTYSGYVSVTQVLEGFVGRFSVEVCDDERNN